MNQAYLDSLQWLGFAFILGGYWLYGKTPRLGAPVSIVGCVFCAIWAALIQPTAWGILCLELFIICINVKNFFQART